MVATFELIDRPLSAPKTMANGEEVKMAKPQRKDGQSKQPWNVSFLSVRIATC